MNAITNTWRGLVQRRLWPVALLLLAALAAVPAVMAKDPDPVPATPLVDGSTGGEDALASKPVVAVASATERETTRKVVGARKNPFRPVVAAKPAAESAPAAPAATPSAGSQPGGSGPQTGTPGASGGTPATPEATPQPDSTGTPKPTYETYSLTVRFGDSTGELETQNLKRLTALPDADNPVLIYLGLLEDGETAVFLVDVSATAQGDGVCDPRPSECQTLHLKKGETEFFDVTGEDGAVTQYQLDLVDIENKKTASAQTARKIAPNGRKAIRGRAAQAAAYQFDIKSGTLQKLSRKAYRAKLASLR